LGKQNDDKIQNAQEDNPDLKTFSGNLSGPAPPTGPITSINSIFSVYEYPSKGILLNYSNDLPTRKIQRLR